MDPVERAELQVQPKLALKRSDTKSRVGMLGVGLSVLVLAWAATAGQGTRIMGAGAESAVDPLLQPAAIEFRRDERIEAGAESAVDPLLQPAAIEFRRDERIEAGAESAVDPLLQPAAIEFRRDERIEANR